MRGFAVWTIFLAVALAVAPSLQAHEGEIAVISAASFDVAGPVAPNSIASVFGAEFAEGTTVAGAAELPTELDTVTVVIEGSDNVERLAQIFAVTKNQLNILLPDLPAGIAHIRAKRGDTVVADGEFEVRRVSPGLFSAAQTGSGLAAALAIRVNPDGSQSVEPVAVFNAERGMFEPMPLNTAASQIYLSLFGTGIRNGAELSATVNGVPVTVLFHGEQGEFPGVDQINLGPLSPELAQQALADLVLTVDGIVANTVQLGFSGSIGDAVTFNNQIVRLFQAHCQVCHHPGEVAEFSLMNYESAKPWARQIRSATRRRYMPPWRPVPGHGDFVDERILDGGELDLIARWVDAGAPEGDPADLPEPLVFNDQWTLGEPDLVLDTGVDYMPDPNSDDDYRCFSIPTELTEGRSIGAVEVRPGNREIAHHVILFADPTGASAGLSANDGQPGYTCFGDGGFEFGGSFFTEAAVLGGWAPGNRPQVLPEGSGYNLRAGSRIAIQIHYHPDGTPRTDRTRIGLHFTDTPSPRNVLVIPVINDQFTIPAEASNHLVTADFTNIFGVRFNVFAVLPHMHLLGREIRMDKVAPNGDSVPMVYIDDWDFDWQDTYTYKEPAIIEPGDSMLVQAWYDNSAANPLNPNRPPIDVGWGERTVDEMCIVFLFGTIQ